MSDIDGDGTARRIKLAWHQFRLRTLLTVMAILGVLMAMLMSAVHSAQTQKAALQRLRCRGTSAVVRYSYEKGETWGSFLPNSPPGPTWLRNLIGPDLFQTVVLVDMRSVWMYHDELAALEDLPSVETIWLGESEVSDDDLRHLRPLRHLTGLGLEHTQIGDNGLVYLEKLTKLHMLLLDGTRVTDAGMEHLQGLTNLEEWLGLGRTRITDASIKYFKNFTKLREINLERTKVTERGVLELKAALPNLHITYTKNGRQDSL